MSRIEFPSSFVERLEKALALDLPYSGIMLRPSQRFAAVLAVFAVSSDPDALASNPTGISLLITRRTDSVQSHQGQMAFPGGRCEPDELERGDTFATALRETEEEVGLSRDLVQVV